MHTSGRLKQIYNGKDKRCRKVCNNFLIFFTLVSKLVRIFEIFFQAKICLTNADKIFIFCKVIGKELEALLQNN